MMLTEWMALFVESSIFIIYLLHSFLLFPHYFIKNHSFVNFFLIVLIPLTMAANGLIITATDLFQLYLITYKTTICRTKVKTESHQAIFYFLIGKKYPEDIIALIQLKQLHAIN